MAEPMNVRELITELQRFDGEMPVVVDGRLVTNVGLRDRPDVGVHPQLYLAADEKRVTHGRHCVCSACAAQDWSEPQLAPCGMHGPSCPPVYAPFTSEQGTKPASTEGER